MKQVKFFRSEFQYRENRSKKAQTWAFEENHVFLGHVIKENSNLYILQLEAFPKEKIEFSTLKEAKEFGLDLLK